MPAIPAPDNQASLRALRALIGQRSLLAALEVFHAALGDIFRLPLPGFNPVMMAGPEANHFVLVEQRGDLRWRTEGDPVTRLLRRGVLVTDGEDHDTVRRAMGPALHKRMIDRYVEAMWQCTDRVTDRWPGDGAPLDMLVEMRRVALLILMKTLFAVDFDADMDRLWRPILRALRYISPGPWLVWHGAPRPGYQTALRRLDSYLYQLIAHRRQTRPEGDDLLGLLIGAGMPDGLIRDQLLTMLIAGHDTSTALLSWALLALVRHPGIQAQARREVLDVLGADPPTPAQTGALRFLDQVIQETLRLYPPIHLGSRIAAAELTFRDYSIAPGTRVLYSIYLTHRDPQHWPDPAAFLPERFTPEQNRQRQPYTYVPFGGGPRNCMGMAFAQVEAKVVLARILQKFELSNAGRRVHPHMGATLEPRPGVLVHVTRRAQPVRG